MATADPATQPRVPSGLQLEAAASLWQRIQAALVDDPELIVDESVIAASFMEASITRPEELLVSLIDAVVWIERREAEAEQLRKDMIARRDRYRTRAKRFRGEISDMMTEVLRIKSARGKLGGASISEGHLSLYIAEGAELADEYTTVTVTRSPNRDAIKADLDEGVIIEGAEMVQGDPILTIRKL